MDDDIRDVAGVHSSTGVFYRNQSCCVCTPSPCLLGNLSVNSSVLKLAETLAHHQRDLFNVPTEYHDLREVFSKHTAQILFPHHPYSCDINMVLGAFSPSG